MSLMQKVAERYLTGSPKEGDITNRILLVDPGKVNSDPSSPLIRLTFYPECQLWFMDEVEEELTSSTFTDADMVRQLHSYFNSYLRGHTLGSWELQGASGGLYPRFVGEVFTHQKQRILNKVMQDLQRLAVKSHARLKICQGGVCHD